MVRRQDVRVQVALGAVRTVAQVGGVPGDFLLEGVWKQNVVELRRYLKLVEGQYYS